MKKLKEHKMEVVPEAIKVAIGASVLAGILYLLEIKYGLLKNFDINIVDVKMIFACAIGFCLLWIALHYWFFTPYIKLFEKREKLTVGAEGDVKEKEAEIEELLEKYEILTLEARSKAMKEKSEVVNKAKADAHASIEAAKIQAQASVANAKKELSERRIQLQKDAQKEAEALASQMISKVLSAVVLVLLTLSPSLAIAASGSHSAGHDVGFWSLKFYIINFAIYFFAILFIAKKNLPSAWKARRISLEQNINSSLRKLKDIEAAYNSAKTKLANVDSHINEIKNNLAQETRREVEDIKLSAEAAIKRIEKQAVDTLSTEQRALESAMKKIYTEAALKLAEEKLKQQINAESDKSLRETTLNNMHGLLN